MDCENLNVRVNHKRLGELIVKRTLPLDKPKIEGFLKRLSEESIYHRFFRLIRDYGEIIDKMLGGKDTLFCITIEHRGEVIGCGEAYKTTWPDVAEPALAVLDEYQGMGIGKLLVAVMCYCALKIGVRRFRAYVFKENIPALRLTKHLSPRVEEDLGDSYLILMNLEESKNIISNILEEYSFPIS